MGIHVKCPNGHELAVKDALAGKKFRCPSCQAIVHVPERIYEARIVERLELQSDEPSPLDNAALFDLDAFDFPAHSGNAAPFDPTAADFAASNTVALTDSLATNDPLEIPLSPAATPPQATAAQTNPQAGHSATTRPESVSPGGVSLLQLFTIATGTGTVSLILVLLLGWMLSPITADSTQPENNSSQGREQAADTHPSDQSYAELGPNDLDSSSRDFQRRIERHSGETLAENSTPEVANRLREQNNAIAASKPPSQRSDNPAVAATPNDRPSNWRRLDRRGATPPSTPGAIVASNAPEAENDFFLPEPPLGVAYDQSTHRLAVLFEKNTLRIYEIPEQLPSEIPPLRTITLEGSAVSLTLKKTSTGTKLFVGGGPPLTIYEIDINEDAPPKSVIAHDAANSILLEFRQSYNPADPFLYGKCMRMSNTHSFGAAIYNTTDSTLIPPTNFNYDNFLVDSTGTEFFLRPSANLARGQHRYIHSKTLLTDFPEQTARDIQQEQEHQGRNSPHIGKPMYLYDNVYIGGVSTLDATATLRLSTLNFMPITVSEELGLLFEHPDPNNLHIANIHSPGKLINLEISSAVDGSSASFELPDPRNVGSVRWHSVRTTAVVAESSRKRALAIRSSQITFVDVSQYVVEPELPFEIQLDGPDEVVANSTSQWTVQTSRNDVNLEVIRNVGEIAPTASASVPLAGETAYLNTALNPQETIIAGGSLRSLTGLGVPSQIQIGSESVVAVGITGTGGITLERSQPQLHPFATPVTVPGINFAPPTITGNVVEWTPSDRNWGTRLLCIRATSGSQSRILTKLVNVKPDIHEVPFAVAGVSSHPTEHKAILWGPAPSEPNEVASQLAIYDLSTRQVKKQIKYEHFISDAKFSQTGVIVLSVDLPRGENPRTSEIEILHEDTLRSKQRKSVPDRYTEIIATHGDAVALHADRSGRSVVHDKLYSLKNLEPMPDDLPNVLDQMFCQRGSGIFWKGIFYNENGKPELIMAPPMLKGPGNINPAGWLSSYRQHRISSPDPLSNKNFTYFGSANITYLFEPPAATIYSPKLAQLLIHDHRIAGRLNVGDVRDIILDSIRSSAPAIYFFHLDTRHVPNALSIPDTSPFISISHEKNLTDSKAGLLAAINGTLVRIQQKGLLQTALCTRILPRQPTMTLELGRQQTLTYQVEGPADKFSLTLYSEPQFNTPNGNGGFTVSESQFYESSASNAEFDVEIAVSDEIMSRAIKTLTLKTAAPSGREIEEAVKVYINQHRDEFKDITGQTLRGVVVPVWAHVTAKDAKYSSTLAELQHIYFVPVTAQQIIRHLTKK